jgi:hypothetical protein
MFSVMISKSTEKCRSLERIERKIPGVRGMVECKVRSMHWLAVGNERVEDDEFKSSARNTRWGLRSWGPCP